MCDSLPRGRAGQHWRANTQDWWALIDISMLIPLDGRERVHYMNKFAINQLQTHPLPIWCRISNYSPAYTGHSQPVYVSRQELTRLQGLQIICALVRLQVYVTAFRCLHYTLKVSVLSSHLNTDETLLLDSEQVSSQSWSHGWLCICVTWWIVLQVVVA